MNTTTLQYPTAGVDQAEGEQSLELGAENFTWFSVPTTKRGWAELAALLATPPPGGWRSAEELRREALELSFDPATVVSVPTCDGLSVPTVEAMRFGVGGGASGAPWRPWSGDVTSTRPPTTRHQRQDRGRRRQPKAQGRSRSMASTVGTLSEPHVGTLSAAYLPAGLVSQLPEFALPVFRAAAIALLDDLADGDREDYLALNAVEARKRFGRPLISGKRHWVWDTVRSALLRLDIIETEQSATSTATYVPKQRSMAYRLSQRWREVVEVELVERGPELWVPEPAIEVPVREDGSAVSTLPWLERWVREVEYDLEAALRLICETYGAQVPERFDFASMQQAILAADVPADILADCEAQRRTRPCKATADWQYDHLGRHIRLTKDAEIILVEHSARDDRPAEVIARGRAMSRVVQLFRWRVDGVCLTKRDAAGYRLHSPVTRLARELRKYMSFLGEPLVGIDAKNSQMTILAAAIAEVRQTADVREFQEICAEGCFYEETYAAHHGRHPTKKERDGWKPTIMGAWLYAHRGCARNSEIGQSLAKRWPYVHGYVINAKDRGTRNLPVEMQRRESAIWVDALGPELEAINCPAITVHDSVYVPCSREAEVRAILERLYAAAGVRATFDS
jgi:hypothetical protein